jgi:RimJ/RimL family protein N-acetyltransferase
MAENAFRIREAVPDDAEAAIAFVQRIAEEPDVCVPLAPGEFNVTVEEERRIIAEYAAAPNGLFLVAESDVDGIIGVCDCKAYKRVAMRHVTTLGVSVRRDRRGRGVGTALVQRVIDWARAGGVVKRIELQVYARNPAVRLYERLGFVVEGRHARAVFQRGEYEDNLSMALLL